MLAVKSCFLCKTIGNCDGAPEGAGTVPVGLQQTSAAVSGSRQSVQIRRYLLISFWGQRSVATRGREHVTCLLPAPLREKHSPS
jgi:hypothetical protein